MRKIVISDEVWAVIAKEGKFGETEDDVLRRLFKLDPSESGRRSQGAGPPGRGSNRKAKMVMRARAANGQLRIEFVGGERKEWSLPEKADREGLRRLRDLAVEWALSKGASDPGQTNAVRKALTDANYHLTK